MKSVNKVIILGNLTRDPEIKETQGSQKIATFGVATNREWKSNNGDKKSLAEFHNVVSWGRLAEICNDFLYKGRPVYIEGYLKTRSWDTESGVKAYRTEIVAQNVVMLGKSKKGVDEEDAISEASSDSSDEFDFDEEIGEFDTDTEKKEE